MSLGGGFPPPPAAVFDQRVIDVGAIGQEYLRKGALVVVLAECLEGDCLSKDSLRSGLLRSIAVSLALLWAVDAVEADTFRVVIVQD